MINDKGFTLIELIMVIVIIAIISVLSAYLMLYLVQNGIFIPNKLNMDMIASDALDIMVEGDSSAKGLRFSKSITDIQDNQISFNNQDDQSVVYRLDTGIQKLYRSIAGGSETLIPYYVETEINITGKDNKLFIYYNDIDNEINPGTGDPADVRRIRINLTARTGTGLYENWEGQSELASSITVKRLE